MAAIMSDWDSSVSPVFDFFLAIEGITNSHDSAVQPYAIQATRPTGSGGLARYANLVERLNILFLSERWCLDTAKK
jgi:hypothetical protein